MRSYKDKTTPGVHIDFDRSLKIHPKEIFTKYKKQFGLSDDDEMRLVHEGVGGKTTNYTYKQYYKGIKVISSGFTLAALEENQLTWGGGGIIENISLPKPSINENEVVEIALKNIPTDEKFCWESSNCIAFMGNKEEAMPKVELQIRPEKGASYLGKNQQMIYRVGVLTEALNSYMVFINAQNGEVIRISDGGI